MNAYSRYAVIVAVFATGLYLALVIAVFGIVTLLTDLEPVGDPDAGVLAGPVMIGAATVAVAAVLLSVGLGRPPERQRVSLLWSFVAAVAAYLAYVVAGFIVLGSGPAAEDGVLPVLVGVAAGPHVFAAAVAAFAVGLAYTAVLGARTGGAERPRWPWEDRDEP
ncbi:DUF6121 family protein [Agromyces archimandritae]|uniref:Uncharacterized protein n=1 Tax=Agromyces archimandritae TaxID=2781962 RepID=A0A975FN41_9MICO|nr:DUF6121 family protein [Agromyces archimandritae]QTX05508.1 hypothetical protein G127AT_04635 [Agromyces archimandritae]